MDRLYSDLFDNKSDKFWRHSKYGSFVYTQIFIEVGDMTARSAGGKGLKCLEDAPEGKEARCPQYFIKWARYSHIHNTWESDVSLEEKACKGLKILENYQKKQQEVAEWSVNFKIM